MHTKKILITGSSHGIGAAIARRFAKEGYALALNCKRDVDALHALANELRETYHATVFTYICDMADYASVTVMCQQVEKDLGTIDVLVNNAGISKIGLFTDLSFQEWQEILATNLTSVFSCTKQILPGMIHNKSGRIINISSVWGSVGASCEVAYSATKGGINALTRGLAKELAPSNIQVNAIACGVIDTRMNRAFSEEERIALEQEIPAGRYGTTDEVADLAWQLACAPAYLTGQIVTLDGAWL